MSMFGKTSAARLSTCHQDLQDLMNEALSESPCDFSIVCGVRGRAEQEKAIAEGKSRAHFGQSPHNYQPSFAVDICPYDHARGLVWNDDRLWSMVLDHIAQVAEEMGIEVKFGRDFHSIVDKPHIELANWKELAKVAELAE